MKAVIQKCLSTKNGAPPSSTLDEKPLTTPGIKSPIIMRYETPTPKHLIMIAPSNTTAAVGYVIWLRAKNDEFPRSKYRAHLVCKYSPNPLVRPAHIMTITPSVIPIFDMACGMASTPAPTIVLTKLTTEETHDAFPAMPFCLVCRFLFRGCCEDVEGGRESLPCSLGTEWMAA